MIRPRPAEAIPGVLSHIAEVILEAEVVPEAEVDRIRDPTPGVDHVRIVARAGVGLPDLDRRGDLRHSRRLRMMRRQRLWRVEAKTPLLKRVSRGPRRT